MSVNPLNELKRRLEDSSIVLPKRLCLARNVVHSHHFPAAPKERVISEWLDWLTQQNRLSAGELKNILGWINAGEDLSSELKTKLIEIVSDFVKNGTLSFDEVQSILTFIENEKITKHVTQNIEENLLISIALLKSLRSIADDIDKVNILIQRILNHLIKHYKESKKKLEFIIKVLDGENLEAIFDLLDTDNRNLVIELCRNILFPLNKKMFFVSFLQTLIRKDNIDELIAEKGDNIQSVLKIMNTFFEFPKGRTTKDYKFLCNYVDVFVTCFREEHQLIFALYIMITSSLNMQQKYLNPNMSMPTIEFEEYDDKIKRNIFLKFLEILLQNDVDITVRLTDTFGEKISKVEIKKNFTGFLQAVMLGLMKLEGKPDKTTMNIITTALQLDPVLIEPNLDKILPPIMAAKKNSSTMETYTNMLKSILQILFKLSRGTLFITQILPSVKLILEACNPEQFELIQKSKEDDSEKIKSKIITSNDIMPQECVDMYGRWTTELMFRQNSEFLMTLQKDFQVHCLMMLEEGYVSPSIITLSDVLSAIVSSFFENNKMADHTVPRHIAEEFWSSFSKFEGECLKKLGECVLKLTYNPTLVKSFLKLSVSFSRLKLINLKYGNIKVDMHAVNSTEVFDFSPILPCLKGKQWATLAGKVQEDDLKMLLDHLVAHKILAVEILNLQSEDETTITEGKSHLIKQITSSDSIEEGYIEKLVLNNLEKGQAKQLAKYLVKTLLSSSETDVFNRNSVVNNRPLLNALAMETLKTITRNIENADTLTKALNKSEFDMATFLKDVNVREYFDSLNVTEENDTAKCIDILKQLQIYYLEEKYQLATIFVMLAVKKSVSKKLKRNIDYLLQSIYELSPKNPDVYKIFPVNFIFSFDEKPLIDLLTLTIKTSNNLLLIISTLETGVKKVKTDSEIVKSIVEILLKKETSKNTSGIEYFSDPVFQISCIILPILAKEKRAITTSAYRSILADLQEKIHTKMLGTFKNIDFSENSILFSQESGNPEDSTVISDNIMAALNAMEAYSLTLSKYCETNDSDGKNLDFLLSGLNFFIINAIKTIQSPDSKPTHIESSIHLLNVSLRHIKKLESHEIFKDKDKLFLKIWRSIKDRLLMVLDQKQKRRVSQSCLDSISTALKFVLELSSIECFVKNFVGDLGNLAALKDLQTLKDEDTANLILTSHKVTKYLTTQSLKANIMGPKCAALAKQTYKICKTLRIWIQDNYEYSLEVKAERIVLEEKEVIMEDVVCDLLRSNLDMLSEIVLAARKIILDYKFLDSIFELLHLVHCILGCNTKRVKCKVSWPAFFKLYDGSLKVLNSLLVSREEILEDRWPCYMQCLRALVFCLCERSSSREQLDTATEDRLAEAAHSIEKLTQSICKRKSHISRLASYAVADISSWLERTTPCKMVRQHLENSIVLFIQASDSNHAMAFLRRALAGSPGQMTMTNLYTMYKRYHKYVGNA